MSSNNQTATCNVCGKVENGKLHIELDRYTNQIECIPCHNRHMNKTFIENLTEELKDQARRLYGTCPSGNCE